MSFKFQRFQAIEIDIPASNAQTKFTFPDQPQLTGNAGLPVIIDSIVSYTQNNLDASPLTYQVVVSAQDLKRAFLTLYQGDLASVNSIPVASLVNTADIDTSAYGQVGVVQQPLVRNLINVSWTKSFVQFATAPTGPTKIVFGVYYTVLATQQDVLDYISTAQ